ncbi:MAG: type V CRISPR-associated protein Cas12k [Hassallia sp.]
MSQITIQCRLVASESSRHQLWKLMAQLNTPLINELLRQVSQHPEFETWRQKAKHPSGVVKELCQPLKDDPRFIGQPARFYTSATTLVNYIYKSWFALMKRCLRRASLTQYQLEGKIRWLEMLNSDIELVEASGVSLDSLRIKAAEILAQLTPVNTTETKSTNRKKAKKRKKSQNSVSDTLSKNLFEAYGNAEDNLTRCAISYLLKNGCKINEKEEDAKKFAQRRRKLEIQIERLREQLETRIPKGQSHILVGISLGLEKPATVAIVDGTTGKVLTYRSIRQLLGENYKLLNRQRQQKHYLSHQRQVAQTLAAPNQFGESELGEYIDRLLAKEIIAIAQTYSAGSIVLPKLDNMREQVQSEIQAKAEQKSDLIEVQQKYAKQYRVSVHQWSYGRLMANIHSSAVKAGIVIEESKQPIRGSPQEKAKELAINAYQSRKA